MKSIFVLTLIAVISGACLYGVNSITENPIVEAKKKIKQDALKGIFMGEITVDSKTKVDDNVLYYISKDGKEFGVAVETYTNTGFSGRIDVLAGISIEGEIIGYKVLDHKETPGLGDKIDHEKFKKQFKGTSFKQYEPEKWKVKKDGGFVDGITAATISSRAITNALKKALDLYHNEKSKK